MRIHRCFLPIIAAGVGITLLISIPAQSAGTARLGDPSSAFDAALGPATLGQSSWYYPLPDGSLARGATANSSLETVPRVLFLQRNWNLDSCASATAAEVTRQQFLPADAQKQWGSASPDGGGTPAGTRVEGWYSNSLAAMLAGSAIKEPGSILVITEYGAGTSCNGAVRLTIDGARSG